MIRVLICLKARVQEVCRLSGQVMRGKTSVADEVLALNLNIHEVANEELKLTLTM